MTRPDTKSSNAILAVALLMLALLLVGLALGGKAGTLARFLVYWFGGLTLTIVLASASYRWLESPFLRLKEKFATVKSRPV